MKIILNPSKIKELDANDAFFENISKEEYAQGVKKLIHLFDDNAKNNINIKSFDYNDIAANEFMLRYASSPETLKLYKWSDNEMIDKIKKIFPDLSNIEIEKIKDSYFFVDFDDYKRIAPRPETTGGFNDPKTGHSFVTTRFDQKTSKVSVVHETMHAISNKEEYVDKITGHNIKKTGFQITITDSNHKSIEKYRGFNECSTELMAMITLGDEYPYENISCSYYDGSIILKNLFNIFDSNDYNIGTFQQNYRASDLTPLRNIFDNKFYPGAFEKLLDEFQISQSNGFDYSNVEEFIRNIIGGSF